MWQFLKFHFNLDKNDWLTWGWANTICNSYVVKGNVSRIALAFQSFKYDLQWNNVYIIAKEQTHGVMYACFKEACPSNMAELWRLYRMYQKILYQDEAEM